MKRIGVVCIIMVLWIGVTVGQSAEFSLSSPQLVPGGQMGEDQVFQGFGCEGSNISPMLSWEHGPEGTASYAVTVYDPDAPTGSGWWHWVMFNIPSTVKTLPLDAGNPKAGLAPAGSVQSRTDFGTTGYGGACPPKGDGDHRYIFTVYALDTPKLDLDQQASGAMVGFFIHQHSIAAASLTVLSGR